MTSFVQSAVATSAETITGRPAAVKPAAKASLPGPGLDDQLAASVMAHMARPAMPAAT